jgi:hypothetical protein
LRLARLLALRSELKELATPEEVETLLAEADKLATTPKLRAGLRLCPLEPKLRKWQGKRPDADGRSGGPEFGAAIPGSASKRSPHRGAAFAGGQFI